MRPLLRGDRRGHADPSDSPGRRDGLDVGLRDRRARLTGVEGLPSGTGDVPVHRAHDPGRCRSRVSGCRCHSPRQRSKSPPPGCDRRRWAPRERSANVHHDHAVTGRGVQHVAAGSVGLGTSRHPATVHQAHLARDGTRRARLLHTFHQTDRPGAVPCPPSGHPRPWCSRQRNPPKGKGPVPDHGRADNGGPRLYASPSRPVS